MNGIKFGQRREAIRKLLEDWQKHVDAEQVDADLKGTLRAAADGAFEVLETKAKYRVSLLGEFSAGKSSLIMALTGAEVDTSPGPTTKEAKEFKWKGVTLVDTPGIQAEADDTDHDEIARASTLDADLILFVLTNELFNDRLATHFHFVAEPDGLGLADKMLVIVNKMDRESNKDEVIISEVENAIKPIRVHVHLAAVDCYLQSQNSEGNRRKRLVERSRIPKLVAEIDEFIKEQGELGRLTRPLHRFEEALEKQRDSLLGDDEGAMQEMENNRRQKRIVSEANRRLTSHESEWVTELRRIALSRTTETLNLVADAKTSEELEEQFQTAIQAIEPEIDTYLVNIVNTLHDWARGLQDEIEDLDTSELGKNIRILRAKTRKSGKFEDPLTQGFDFVKASRNMLNEGLGSVLGNISENPKSVVKLVGRFKKFGPWGKIKLGRKAAETAGKAGKALGPLAAAIDFYVEYRDEKNRDAKERRLAKIRLSMQREFQNMADWHVEELRKELDSIRKDTIHKMLHQLEEQAAKIAADEAKEKGVADLASEFIGRSRSLRNEISAAGD